MIRRVSAPLRIDICGGSLDIPPIPTELGPVHVVSAAINQRVTGVLDTTKGLHLEYDMPTGIPTGSGLGSSGCMNLVWLALVTGSTDRYWLADSVFNIERGTGVVGGTQDQYTTSVGGINLLTMNHDRVWVTPILHSGDPAVKMLEDHMLIVDSGITRSATGMNDQFIQRYKRGDLYQELCQLNKLSKIIYGELVHLNTLVPSVLTHTLGSIAAMLSREWDIRKVLMPSNTTEIDNILGEISTVCSQEVGARVCGAAGGGSIILLEPSIDKIEGIRDKVTSMGLNIIDFKFDFEGITMIEGI
jgi:galactokinase/mevalonate kinase-like predicted kinase